MIISTHAKYILYKVVNNYMQLYVEVEVEVDVSYVVPGISSRISLLVIKSLSASLDLVI